MNGGEGGQEKERGRGGRTGGSKEEGEGGQEKVKMKGREDSRR